MGRMEVQCSAALRDVSSTCIADVGRTDAQDFSEKVALARVPQQRTLGRVLTAWALHMSKRTSEGEVLSSKLAVGLARFQQQHFAALFGGSAPAVAESHDETPGEPPSFAHLKGDGDDESCVARPMRACISPG
jgi:hypothetical protein